MKKIYQSSKHKAHARARMYHEERQRATHDARLVRRKNSIDLYDHSHKYKPKDKREWYDLVAPENFSLIDNQDEMLRYFREARNQIEKRNQIRFNLAGIEHMTPDAIALLIAHVQDASFNHGIRIRGIPPKDQDLAKIFALSGFYDHVSTDLPVTKSKSNMLLHRVTNNKVENVIAKRASIMAVTHTFKDGRKFRPIYEILIEAMANTNNHAGHRAGMYDWWIFIYNYPDEDVTAFSFVDLGVGIFQSLSVQSFVRKFATALGITSNAALVPRLFTGEISSRTGLEERGKGLPLIYNHAQNHNFRTFKIIANDVYADLKTGINIEMGAPLLGTFLYFELSPLVAES